MVSSAWPKADRNASLLRRRHSAAKESQDKYIIQHSGRLQDTTDVDVLIQRLSLKMTGPSARRLFPSSTNDKHHIEHIPDA